MVMGKKDFIEAVAKHGEMTKKAADESVTAVIETIMDVLSAGDSINLVGFGKFETVHQEACTRRNPSTGETVEVPAKNVPKFHFSRVFKKSVE